VTAHLGDRADPERDEITLDGERLHLEALEYWLVNKPVGVLSTVHDPEGRPTVLELVPRRRGRLFPVGRLDRDTSGLLLLTNDGALTQALLHPSHEIDREYEVVVKGEFDERAQQRLARGVRIDEAWTAPARVTRVRFDAESERTLFHLTLHEGRKRQIRRSLRILGCPVRSLRRVRIGPLRLGDLAPGAARRLSRAEREALAALVGGAQPRGKTKRKQGPRQRKPKGPPAARGSSRICLIQLWNSE
jgi:23S rRNA pseudouridine2605 synthase